MAHKISVASGAGDTAVAEWEVEDAESVAVAKGVFDQATNEGWGAVAERPGTEGAQRVDSFSPELEDVMLLRPIAGG